MFVCMLTMFRKEPRTYIHGETAGRSAPKGFAVPCPTGPMNQQTQQDHSRRSTDRRAIDTPAIDLTGRGARPVSPRQHGHVLVMIATTSRTKKK